MLTKTEVQMLPQAMQRELQAGVPELCKCAVGIAVVAAVAFAGPIIGLDTGIRAADVVALLGDGGVLEHLVGLGF